MNDSVERWEVIELLSDRRCNTNCFDESGQKIYEELSKAIENVKDLPSAQPEPSQVARDIATIIENEQDMRVMLKNAQPDAPDTNGGDIIYRRAAIDAADRADYTGLAIEDVKKVTDEVVKEIKKLPSAQPEIIRCKDCKHKHIENMVWTCPFGLPGGENFFCGYGAELYKGEQE